MISLNFLKLIYFLRSWAGKGWIRAIPRSFGASNSCHCHGRRPHFGTCLTSLWLPKPLFSQRGNFSRLASTRKHRQQVHASEMRDVRKAHINQNQNVPTLLSNRCYTPTGIYIWRARGWDPGAYRFPSSLALTESRKCVPTEWNLLRPHGVKQGVWFVFFCFRYVQWKVWLS